MRKRRLRGLACKYIREAELESLYQPLTTTFARKKSRNPLKRRSFMNKE